jgi:hypothetical protein
LVVALQVLDNLPGLPRLFGRCLPLETVWGSQPGVISADDREFVHTDYKGRMRCIPWAEVRQLRQATSSEWVSAGSSALSMGVPGGGTALVSSGGALRFDSDIHSYPELAELVAGHVPEELHDRRDFFGTFRGTLGVWLVAVPVILACFGCPTMAVLSLESDSGWIVVLKILVGAVMAILAFGWTLILVWQVVDSIRLYRFLSPRARFLNPNRLPEPPPPVDHLAPSAESHLRQERRSL